MASPLRSAPDRLLTTARARAAGSRTRLVAAVRASQRFLLSLGLLLGLLAFMAAAPIRSLDEANSDVAQLRAAKEQLTTSIDELEQRKARLEDPREVELLARTRFGFVHPGETAYVVVTDEDEVQADAQPARPDERRAWYEWLLDSVVDMLPT